MAEIITFGSACWDAFMKVKQAKEVKSKKFISQKGICFNLGSKIDIKDVFFFSGGGGTNSAATFVNQGFKAEFCGMVGDDLLGKEVIDDLKKHKIGIDLIVKTPKKATNYSVVLKTSKATDRTILVFRGASELLTKKDIPWNRAKKAKWFYLAPLSGKLAKNTKDIVGFAKKNKIKVAFNPGNSQLCLAKKELQDIIKKTDILILNQEEASLLTGIKYNKEKNIFKKIDDICPGIAIMTKGPEGVSVSDGRHLFSAKGFKGNFIDNTGAGDAFGSGFVSGFLQSKGNVKYAIQLGMANSVSCLNHWGAKGGLLKKKQKFKKVKVKKEACLGHNCKLK